CAVFAQTPYSKIEYRSAENKLYWKNRPPNAGYWQQDVHYVINAELDDKTLGVTGDENLTYWNNSPDTLSFVFFHVYQNAFTPGSYMSKLFLQNHDKPKYGNNEKQDWG